MIGFLLLPWRRPSQPLLLLLLLLRRRLWRLMSMKPTPALSSPVEEEPAEAQKQEKRRKREGEE